MLLHNLLCWLSVSSISFAGAVPRIVPHKSSPVIAERQDGSCANGPHTRACWSKGFSIETDFDAKAPPAGKEVTVRCLC
jgi:hypothetical protein